MHERSVRWYQSRLFRYMLDTERDARAIEIAHRRWGKDEIALGVTGILAQRRPAPYWHCFPEFAQARRALWDAVNPHTGRKRIDEAFPIEMRKRTNHQQMFIEFHNGATWQLIGSDNYDTTVGSSPAGIVYSEWALCNPNAWAYHRPMLVENGGWAMFITTPRGRNHAYDMYRRALRSDRWFAERQQISFTRALTKEQLAEALEEYEDIYGADYGRAQFKQEYYCDFNAAILGAFYGREMADVRGEGRIVADLEIVPDLPIYTAWDIGVRDDTSIWWFQVVGRQLYVIDCFTSPGCDVPSLAEMCREKEAENGWPEAKWDFVPHDVMVREWGSGRTRLETMQMHGLHPFRVPSVSKLDGINAVRRTLPRCVFHERCEEVGVSALEQYHRQWDTDRKQFAQTEFKDWTCHLSDAFRYLSLAWRHLPDEKAPMRDPQWHHDWQQVRPPVKGQIPLPPPPDDRRRKWA